MNNEFSAWLRSESEDRDAIRVKRVYIDINDGNILDGVLFSQIMYWHSPKRDGTSRLQVEKEGHLWLVKRYDEWYEECRIPERTARDALQRISERGLIEKKVWKFGGVPCVHIRVIPDAFINAVNDLNDEKDNSNRQKTSEPIGRKRQKKVTESVTSFNTETTTETTTETKDHAVANANGANGKTPPTKPLNEYQQFTKKLGDICDMDTTIKSVGKIVGVNAAELWRVGYKIPDLEKFEKWWYINDWRGKKRQKPNLTNVKSLIKQATQVAKIEPVPDKPAQSTFPPGLKPYHLMEKEKQHG